MLIFIEQDGTICILTQKAHQHLAATREHIFEKQPTPNR